jgi:predicted aspartyl protease
MSSFTTQIPNLEKIGPIIEVIVSPPKDLVDALKKANQSIPSAVKVHAMIDTGASSSVVNPTVVSHLKLNPIGCVQISTPSSTNVTCLQYKAAITFPGDVTLETLELIPEIDQILQKGITEFRDCFEITQ